MDSHYKQALQKASRLLVANKALLVTAGAGIGVDSGLPDFRGSEGFWKAYPPMKKLGLSFPEMSTPSWFHNDPSFAWGFFGHRYNLYTSVEPHQGFQILHNLAESRPDGYFVLTSNVDGHFQKAGFSEDKIFEIHGSIHHWQCCHLCSEIWRANQQIHVDEETFRASSPLPSCPICQRLAQPNILMFNDHSFNSTRSNKQEALFNEFIKRVSQVEIPLVIIELGCGLAVPTIRWYGEHILTLCKNSHLIRINPAISDLTTKENDNITNLCTTALKALQDLSTELEALQIR